MQSGNNPRTILMSVRKKWDNVVFVCLRERERGKRKGKSAKEDWGKVTNSPNFRISRDPGAASSYFPLSDNHPPHHISLQEEMRCYHVRKTTSLYLFLLIYTTKQYNIVYLLSDWAPPTTPPPPPSLHFYNFASEWVSK